MKERDKSLKPLHPGEILSEEFYEADGHYSVSARQGPLGEAIENQ